jgi:hypothetical protein
VTAEFSCTEGSTGPGISSCVGTAASGSDIDTTTPGTHTFTVTATSTDGQSTTRTVTYTVRPDNREAPRFKALASGAFIVTVKLPGPGRVDILVTVWDDNLATTAKLLNPAPHRFVFARGHAIAQRAVGLIWPRVVTSPGVAALAGEGSAWSGIRERAW